MKRRARLGKLEWALIVASAFAALLAIGVIMSPSGSTGAGQAVSSIDAGAAGVPAAPAYDPGPQAELSDNGNGAKQTERFVVSGDWDLAYDFDCSNVGGDGNFIVYIRDASDGGMSDNLGLNELADSGHDVTHEHHGGVYYLAIITACHWSITVTDNL